LRYEFDYAASRFGILTPHRIVAISYGNGRTLPGNVPELQLGGKITYNYAGFHRFEVTSDDTLKPRAKP
jgi:hypothetical protein